MSEHPTGTPQELRIPLSIGSEHHTTSMVIALLVEKGIFGPDDIQKIIDKAPAEVAELVAIRMKPFQK